MSILQPNYVRQDSLGQGDLCQNLLEYKPEPKQTFVSQVRKVFKVKKGSVCDFLLLLN